MGKRAQWKKYQKELERVSQVRKKVFDLHIFTHWQFWVAVVAFVLVFGYPLFTNTTVYKKYVQRLSGEELAVAVDKQAVISTDKGQIVIDFYKENAPLTRENFIRLTSRGYFNGVAFHRVIPDFVVQGGDPTGDGTGGTSAWGKPFVDEIDSLSPLYQKGYVEGTVAMANSGANTNGSQFFIVLKDQPDLPRQYTIFGHVTSGMDVVHKIAAGDKMTKVEVR